MPAGRQVLLPFLVLLTGLLALQRQAPHALAQDAPDFAAVDACLQQEMRDKGIPGASMAIALDGELAHASAFGLRRAGAPERVDTETIFRINSSTKMMAAAAVMREVEAGRLDLQAPITDAIPELALKPPWQASSLTLHTLLANAGGLPDPYLDFSQMPQRYVMPEADVDLSAWARGMVNMHLYAPPGSFWNYSSPNFSLAGLAVERSSGQRFEDYVTEQLWRPAGMTVTTFDPEAVVASGNYAVGHVNGQFWGEPGDHQRLHAAPAGGAYSTPSELVVWAQQLLEQGGAILAPASVSAMTRPYFKAEAVPWSPRSSYGYGIFIDDFRRIDDPARVVQVMRHPGNGRGYGTELVWVPELGFAVVTLINNHATMQRTVDCALRELAGLEPKPIPGLRTPPSAYARYAGSYAVQDVYGARWTAKITHVGGQLRFAYSDWALAPSIAAAYPDGAPMEPLFLDSFRYSYGGSQTITFEPGGNDPRHAGWLTNRYFVGQRVGDLPDRLDLEGSACASLDFEPGLDAPAFAARAYGLTETRVWKDTPIAQDDADDPAASQIKIDLDLEGPLGYLNAWLFEEADDNLELYLMQDQDQDGRFAWPEEIVERLTSPAAQGLFVPAREAPGAYQLWVHGERVGGADSRFDLELIAVAGQALTLDGLPEQLTAGQPARFEVCADPEALPANPGAEPAAERVGIVELDFGRPGAIARVPVRWTPGQPPQPRIYLPRIGRDR